ncbi:MAG: hypothetical protein HY908_27790 [Myxococcales bacterium]|nr:hypothetical protein [Myxococcales bacterium]
MSTLPRFSLVPAVVLGALGLPACGVESASLPTFPDRAAEDRTPLSAPCDAMDPTRCLLPWPSSTFTVVDPATPTGLRVHVEASSLEIADQPAALERADGFSIVTPLVAGFSVGIDASSLASSTDAPMLLVAAEPGSPRRGELVPLHLAQVTRGPGEPPETLVYGLPREPLTPNSDYVVVVLDSLRTADGSAPAPSDAARTALGLRSPETEADARLLAYHAPTRALLAEVGIVPERVLRVWDFTTRSEGDATQRLLAMRAAALEAVDTNTVAVAVDSAAPGVSPVALVVEGRLTGLPAFVADDGAPHLDGAGAPVAVGVHDAPFRVAIPEGQGDYAILMYGHGNGGNVQDSLLDAELAATGIGKVSIQWTGWHDTASAGTLLGLAHMYTGADRASSYLLQALADEAAIQRALSGLLGDVLAAADVGGLPSPVAGRRPDVATVFVGGGSLGGSMGLVHASVDEAVAAAVLNVPGAGWTHFLAAGSMWQSLVPVLRLSYPSELDLYLALLESQTIWDVVDGAVWAGRRGVASPVALVQESIGDPIVPNLVTELLGVAAGAQLVRPVLVDIPALEQVDAALGATGLMQYRVAGPDELDIHGFAGRDTPAGRAAREQMVAFLQSVLAGAPSIVVPSGCTTGTPNGDCDFSLVP